MTLTRPPPPATQRPALVFSGVLLALCGLARGMFDVAAQHLTGSRADSLHAAFYAPFLLAAGYGFTPLQAKSAAYTGLGACFLASGVLIAAAVLKSFGMACGLAALLSAGIASVELVANCTIARDPRPAAHLALVNGFGALARVLGSVVASKGVFVHGEFSATNAGYAALGVTVLSLLTCGAVWGVSLPQPPRTTNAGRTTSWVATLIAFPVGFLALGAQASLVAHTTRFLAQSTASVAAVPTYSAPDLALGAVAVAAAAQLAAYTYLRKMDPSAALAMHAFLAAVFAVLVAVITRTGGIVCLYLLSLSQAACFPLFFAVATAGTSNKAIAGGVVIAATSGGSVIPLIQRLVASATTIPTSFPLLVAGFIPLSVYAFGMWIYETKRTGGEMVAWHDEWCERPTIAVHQPEWQTYDDDLELVSREVSRERIQA
ncbi:hypothetical protein Q8F55_008263 [Vanrija albida]|uniref:Major facilitator superfamily (MFS) profile domain-containing protein n=1 Tax=Vanrija albida TaxID=181172 RepID=A0ABR3PVS2_9TREE